MRLLSVELNGFRGFSGRQSVDLNADAIILTGANGSGKTSLFDGILWALTGQIPRLTNDNAHLVSMYSDTGQARVELQFKESSTNDRYSVTRSFDGQGTRIALKAGENSYQGPVAEAHLINLIWPDAATALKPQQALADLLTRSVYLQQDVIRHFVEIASDEDRFAAVSELVGAGRVTELQDTLERAKKAWSTATNQRQEELRPFRERLAVIEARLSELTRRELETPPSITSAVWDDWWQSLSALGLKSVKVELASREAPSAIDSAIKELTALRRSTERRLMEINAIGTEITALAAKPVPMIPPLVEKVSSLRTEIDDLKSVISAEQERLAELRSRQTAFKEKTDQLKALAVLALENLGVHCPVCLQTYDREATRLRLEELAQRTVRDDRTDLESERLPQLLASLEEKEKELGAAEIAQRSAERSVNEYETARKTVATRLDDLRIPSDQQNSEALAKMMEEAEGLTHRITELQRIGESLSLGLVHSSAAATISELRRETETLRRESRDGERLLAARNQTGDLAQRVIEALREASLEVVEERLREITPLLQSIYTRIDPHPAFRVIRFMSRIYNKKGLLSTVVNDPVEFKESPLPSVVLSSSQINALAVSVFLALNIGVAKPPLSVLMLDDPMQSLDDINLLGLVDLPRRAKGRRQLLVSTHDTRFGTLLSRKLRPADENERTILIELDSWSRRGPNVEIHDVRSDPVPLRLVAS